MSEWKRPLPQMQPFSKPFWDAARAHELVIQHCGDCNALIFYPRRECPECWSTNLDWKKASGKATLYSFSVTYEGVEEMFIDDLPIVLAWVDLEEGIRMTTNIIDCDPEDVHIGMELEVAWRDVTDAISLPFFRPVRS
jgi:uncharacterized OB-fold protein